MSGLQSIGLGPGFIVQDVYTVIDLGQDEKLVNQRFVDCISHPPHPIHASLFDPNRTCQCPNPIPTQDKSKSITQRLPIPAIYLCMQAQMQLHRLNNNQLLNRVVALAPVHPVPSSVGQRAAHGPHGGDGSLECAFVMLVTDQ
jgi:hypothetical protein